MLKIFHHPNSLTHHMGNDHLEAPKRVLLIEQSIRTATFQTDFNKANPATIDDILAVHTSSLYNTIKDSQNYARVELTPDTTTNKNTFSAALTAAGGAIQTVNSARKRHSFSLTRPPGHHATLGVAMGFCFFNNIAIATQNLLNQGIEKIAIIDIDNHHGNGTQSIFERDPNVLYLSLHADPKITFPGTGQMQEIGIGEGIGRTVNIPLPYMTRDAAYLYVFDSIAIQILEQYNPEIILVSLGLDGLEGDPYGSLGLSVDVFFELGKRIGRLANQITNNKVGVILEGGYRYDLIGQATREFFQGLLNFDEATRIEPELTDNIQNIIYSVKSIQRSYWYNI